MEAVDARRFAPGTVVADRYRIVSLAGLGGMGEVYRALSSAIGRARGRWSHTPPAGKSTPRILRRCSPTDTPLTSDMTRWYAWRTFVLAALIAGLATWGFRNVLGRQSALPGGVLEE